MNLKMDRSVEMVESIIKKIKKGSKMMKIKYGKLKKVKEGRGN